MRIPLTGGAYEAHSLAAAAQRQVNLYSEPIPQGTGEPAPVALFPTPGLRTLATMPQAPVRGIHSATTGALYVVAGAGVYAVSTAWVPTLLGSITAGRTNPVSMADNGIEMVIVDGSGNGWKVTLAGNAFAQIVDPNAVFRGGGRVDYLDTFFLFSVPGTPQFQVSDSLAVTFDPLYFANKEAASDLLVTLIVAKREIWLLGSKTTEVWYNKGGADFPFESMPGVFIDRGCAAAYSVAEADNAVYWLSQDRYGAGIVLQGAGYQATRISTYAIEAELTTYSTIADAIGYTYQMAGHVFYVLSFPAADKTWVYDVTTKLWHELVWLDANGAEHRHRANCAAAGYGIVVCGDHTSGDLYALDPAVFTDADLPIKRLRSFPHLVADGKRQMFRQFIADMDTGNIAPVLTTPGGVAESYSVNLIHCGITSATAYIDASYQGFPRPFRYFLLSMWGCLGSSPEHGNQIISLNNPTVFGIVSLTRTLVRVRLIPHLTGLPSIDAQWTVPDADVLQHLLVSVDGVGQVAQVYINDAPAAVASGGWVGSPSQFDISGLPYNSWIVDSSGSVVPGPGQGDVYAAAPAAFFDLSVTANRRKFIKADLTAVDLGSAALGPLGVAPQIWLTGRSGVPADFATNRGSGGGTWTTGTLAFQAPGICVIPTPNEVEAQPPLTDNLISLRWSDDRGHSWSNPVTQPFGAAGEYDRSLQWNRCGYARSRVWELFWSVPAPTALLGAWVDRTPAQT